MLKQQSVFCNKNQTSLITKLIACSNSKLIYLNVNINSFPSHLFLNSLNF